MVTAIPVPRTHIPGPTDASCPPRRSVSIALAASMYFATRRRAAADTRVMEMTEPAGVKPSERWPTTANSAMTAMRTTPGHASAASIDQLVAVEDCTASKASDAAATPAPIRMRTRDGCIEDTLLGLAQRVRWAEGSPPRAALPGHRRGGRSPGEPRHTERIGTEWCHLRGFG